MNEEKSLGMSTTIGQHVFLALCSQGKRMKHN